MNQLLEILKFTIPSLVVFLTIYFVLKSFFNQQVQLKALDIRHETLKIALPAKLQAYERLSLFCERIAIPSLILRLNTPGTNVTSLKYAMLISIQAEYEHNITQQMYVSEQLWKIIKIASDQTVDTINVIGNNVDGNGPADSFVESYYQFLEKTNMHPLDTALSAIKQESAQLLG